MKPMKTPGVYIVEKSAFPNSVVQVATAVPAFIGYTEKAVMGNQSLDMKPKRLTSMAEFESFYGGRPEMQFTLGEGTGKQEIDTSSVENMLPYADFDAIIGGRSKKYYIRQAGTAYCLYAAMRHFFLSGGGACYVVSVGDYEATISAKKLLAGIKTLKKEQEPTMVVIPETTRLSRADSQKVQQQMLSHCGYEMKNRVAILDIFNGFNEVESDQGEPIADFRDDIGTNFLDFGTSYYPWVNSSIFTDRDFTYADIEGDSRELFVKLMERNALETAGIEETDEKKAPPVKNEVDGAAFVAPVPGQVTVSRPETVMIDNIVTDENNIDPATMVFKDAKDGDRKSFSDPKTGTWTIEDDDVRFVPIKDFEGTEAKVILSCKTKAVPEEKNDKGEVTQAKVAAKEVTPPIEIVVKVDEAYPRTAATDKALRAIAPLYKEVLAEMTRVANTMPPAASMAGLYTMVDSTRGVWKAPANVSMPGVTGPCVNIDHDAQEDLNVTPMGKSVNAIRPFVGEGTLVWGARTLDGNSLDWRYISVRRTMIMMEESIRLASKAYVFEPNVASTWVTMKAMIENFLYGIWKQGGLAGAVPEDAYSVHVGLGDTMTPVDILEGILRITVLVAVSRPAEFIEITFQQQMQKS